MNYGSPGVGAANHLVAELFNSKAGLKMTHVPFRGTALAVANAMGLSAIGVDLSSRMVKRARALRLEVET